LEDDRSTALRDTNLLQLARGAGMLGQHERLWYADDEFKSSETAQHKALTDIGELIDRLGQFGIVDPRGLFFEKSSA
jgi:hypothetical protein